MSDAAEGAPAGAASILVVDDRRANLVALDALLAPLGRRVVLAESGEEALRRVLAEEFAVILLDVQMPGMDGFETARYIRGRPSSRHVPIVFVTAISTDAEHVFAGYEAGAVDYVLKPVNPDVLRSKVSVFIELHEANARLRRQTELRTAHESLALAQLSGMSGVWDWDVPAGRLFLSAQYAELCGMDPGAPEREDAWLDVVHPADRDRVTRRLGQLMEAGEDWDEEYRIVHPERGIRWLAARGRLYRGPGGEPERFTGIAVDVTDRKRAEARTVRLHEATAALSGAASSAEVTRQILERAPAATGARSAALWFADGSSAGPAPAAEVEALARRALSERAPVVADGGRLVLATLGAGEAAPGVLVLSYGRAASPDEEGLAFLAAFGAQCAQALERARLFDAERRARERAHFSADVSLTLDAAEFGVQGRLDRLAGLLVPRLADACLIELDQDGQVEVVAVRAGSPEVEDALGAARGRPSREQDPGVVNEVLVTGEPRVLADAATLPRRLAGAGAPADLVQRLARLGLAAAVVVPLSARGRLLGAITLVSLDPARVFDEEDVRMASDVGRRAGLAVDNARLYEQQAGVALTLQRSLLPRELPAVRGLTWAGRYISKATGTEAGGDWFVAVPIDETRVALAVGDVVGRGTEAAAVMGQLRSATRAYATAGMPPGVILSHLSRLAEAIPGAFASTAACIEIDLASGRLRHARAGHPPPLLIGPSGEARFLETPDGTVLGVRHDHHPEVVADVPEGGVVVLYTDGAIERRGEPLDTGLERLAHTAAAAWPAAPAALCEELVTRLFASDPPDDDVALLVARRGAPRPLALRLPARPEALGEARHGVREWLRTLPMTPAAREDVVLACGEALANAVEHGGAGGRAGTTMWIDGAWEEDGVVSLTVRDDGRWTPPVPDPEGRRGRGIGLMRRIMDAVEIDPADDHTKVSMSLRPEAPSTVVVGSATAPAAAPARFAPASAEVVALDGLRMVRLLGEVDASSVPSLRAEIAPLLDAEGPLTIDVAGVSYIDSAGMRLLWEVAAALERRGERLGLIAPPGSRARRALEMSGPDVAGLPDGSLIGDAM